MSASIYCHHLHKNLSLWNDIFLQKDKKRSNVSSAGRMAARVEKVAKTFPEIVLQTTKENGKLKRKKKETE